MASLRKLIPWAADTGINFLQLPPINEAEYIKKDYSPISSIALDPIYLDLTQIPEITPRELLKNAPDEQKSLRWARYHKDQLLRKAFQQFNDRKTPDADFIAFQQEEKEWLSTYSLFRFLMALEKESADWVNWRSEYNSAEKAFSWLESHLVDHADKIYPEILYYEWLQWHCHSQWRKLKEFALSYNIRLMGEIEFDMALHSADTFFQQENFYLHADHTSSRYDHDHLANTSYQWWRRRLTKHTEVFSILHLNKAPEDHNILRLLKDYPDTEFIWEPREKVSREFAVTLNKQLPLLPFYCLQQGNHTSPLPTQNFPYTSYAAFSPDSELSSSQMWNTLRATLEEVEHRDRAQAIKNIKLLGEVSRTPSPVYIKTCLRCSAIRSEHPMGYH